MHRANESSRPLTPSRPSRGVVFHSAHVHRSSVGDRVRVRVKLERPTRGFYIGTAEVSQAKVGDLHCAAEATIKALSQAVGQEKPISLELQDLKTFDAFGDTAVMLRVTATLEDQTRSLMGYSAIGEDGATAAARAVLDATNRLLGVG